MFEESGREGGERIVGSAFTYGSSARYSDYSVHTFDINEYKFWNGIYWYIQYIPVHIYILYIPGIPCLVQNVRTVTNRSTDWDEIARIIFSGIFSNSSLTPRCASD